MSYILTDITLVKQLAGIAAGELSDSEVSQYASDVSDDIYEHYGRPLRKTTTLLTTDEYLYSLDRFKKKIYSIEYVEVAGSDVTSGSTTGSYSCDYSSGVITIGSDLLGSQVGQRLEVEWVPQIFHVYATYRTAQKCLQSLYVFSGDTTTSPRIEFINNEVARLGSSLSTGGVGILRSSQYEGYDPRRGQWVDQDFDNRF